MTDGMTLYEKGRTCLDCINSGSRSRLNPDDVVCRMDGGRFVNLYGSHKRCERYEFCAGHREKMNALDFRYREYEET